MWKFVSGIALLMPCRVYNFLQLTILPVLVVFYPYPNGIQAFGTHTYTILTNYKPKFSTDFFLRNTGCHIGFQNHQVSSQYLH